MAESVAEFGTRGSPAEPDGRLDASTYHRNHEAIWRALAPTLQARTGNVLEVGSGTGQHVIYFAKQAPQLMWWPSDVSEHHLRSIEAWRRFAHADNVRPAAKIDVAAPNWQWNPDHRQAQLTAIVCANVIHIAPWRVAEGLFAGAARHLRPDGLLYLYGPFKTGGEHTAPSNAAFDAMLRAENPAWGVRDIDDLRALAERCGLSHAATAPLPANNMVLTFARWPVTP